MSHEFWWLERETLVGHLVFAVSGLLVQEHLVVRSLYMSPVRGRNGLDHQMIANGTFLESNEKNIKLVIFI